MPLADTTMCMTRHTATIMIAAWLFAWRRLPHADAGYDDGDGDDGGDEDDDDDADGYDDADGDDDADDGDGGDEDGDDAGHEHNGCELKT